ncbi:hypothetical protein D9M69_647620 [compost metagenome]
MTNSPIRCDAAPIEGSRLWMRDSMACGEPRCVSAAADGVREERLDVAMAGRCTESGCEGNDILSAAAAAVAHATGGR